MATQAVLLIGHDTGANICLVVHIQLGGTGQNGQVMLDLGPDLSTPIEKIFKQADYVASAGARASFAEVVAAIRSGSTYYNLLTKACGMGEIRGQITP